jgi:hypothetical protein
MKSSSSIVLIVSVTYFLLARVKLGAIKNYEIFLYVSQIMSILLALTVFEAAAQVQPRAPNFQYFER